MPTTDGYQWDGPGYERMFVTTVWPVVRKAGQGELEAQAMLYRMYAYPIYSYLRRKGCGPDDAADLVHDLFYKLLDGNGFSGVNAEKGRLRTWLLRCTDNLLSDGVRKSERQKRGGGEPTISWDALEAENRYRLEPVDPGALEHRFDYTWAQALLQRAMDKLRRECAERMSADRFAVLLGLLVGEGPEITYAGAARSLGVSEKAIKSAMSRLRMRLRQLLREEVSLTVGSGEDLEEEVRYLQKVLRG